MLRRRSPFAAALLASLVLMAGCGQLTAPGLSGANLGNGFGAMADAADVETQIERAKIQSTSEGTLVKALPVPSKAKPITFLTYKALDNNLGMTLSQHLNTLEKVGSSQNVNAIAFTDDTGPNNTRKYYFRQDNDFDKITSPYLAADKRGDLDSGSGETLRRALKWGFETYPSRFRWLDVNNHGAGYYGIATDDSKGSIIRLPQLAKALKSQPIDLVTFDACLMATVEVAYELRDSAKVMVASEDESYALGMNYDTTLAALAKQPETDPAALARQILLRAQRKGNVKALFTISAIDLSKAGGLTQAVDQLSVALIQALPTKKAPIMMSLKAVKAFSLAGESGGDFNHRDLHEVIVQLKQRVDDPAVQKACQAVQDRLFNRGGAIIMSRAVNEELKVPRGLSVYIPLDGKVDPVYLDTAFAKATRWDEFIVALAK